MESSSQMEDPTVNNLCQFCSAAMTTESTSTPVKAEPGFFTGMNPFVLALAWIWIGALVTAGILAIAGAGEEEKLFGDGSVQLLWAGVFSAIGLSALLTWLLANALMWKPQPTPPAQS